MVQIASLVAAFRADTSGLERGAADAKGALQQVGQQAQKTAQEIDATAARMAKSLGGTAASWREVLEHSGFEKVGAAAQQTARAIDDVAAATQRAATAAQSTNLARAHQAGATGFTATAAQATGVANPAAQRAAQASGGGAGGVSNSDVLRFGAGVAGVGLGLSIVTGVAQQIHAQIRQVVDDQLDWERSAKTLSGVYGQLGDHLQRVAEVQATLPGVAGRQEVFAQALLSANDLRQRYGLSEESVIQLTTAGGRAAGAFGITDEQQQLALQRRIQEAVRSGQDIPEYGVFVDPEVMARRLGGSGAAAFSAFTPREQMEARAAVVLGQFNTAVEQANQNQRAALDAVTARQRAEDQARDRIQNAFESPTALNKYSNAAVGSLTDAGGFAFLAQRNRDQRLASANIQGLSAIDAESNVLRATDSYVRSLTDATREQAQNVAKIKELNASVDGAVFRLHSFFGSVEDPNSILRGDTVAQVQASVAARTQHAIPAIGMLQGDVVAGATSDAYQSAWQNFTADIAQNERRNALQEEFQRRIQFGPADQRAAAARRLEQANQAEPTFQRLREAGQGQQLLDFRSAETQAGLQQIALQQQERQVQLLRETLGLRMQDVQQQRQGILAGMDVVRLQQQGLGAQYALADANYAQQRTQALARQYIGRSLRGQSTAGLPSINDLIQQNVNSQFDIAERTPAALEAGHRVDVAQRSATAVGLGQQLTEGQLQYAQLGTDLKNLGDLPSQTALMLEDLQNSRDQLDVAKDIRELQKDLVKIFTSRGGPSTSGSSQALDELINRVALEVLGADSAGANIAAPELPGNRHGPS